MKKITLQYKCRRCGARYYDPTITYLIRVNQMMDTPALMTMIHDCNDNDDKSRFGIADLIGCKVGE
jgi:hypothetical protein